jgi:hypothetical protein
MVHRHAVGVVLGGVPLQDRLSERPPNPRLSGVEILIGAPLDFARQVSRQFEMYLDGKFDARHDSLLASLRARLVSAV